MPDLVNAIEELEKIVDSRISYSSEEEWRNHINESFDEMRSIAYDEVVPEFLQDKIEEVSDCLHLTYQEVKDSILELSRHCENIL